MNERPSEKWPLIESPWMVTSLTRPDSTSARKSEKARLVCGPREEGLWNRLKSAISSRPMMTQSARFLLKLFSSPALAGSPQSCLSPTCVNPQANAPVPVGIP